VVRAQQQPSNTTAAGVVLRNKENTYANAPSIKCRGENGLRLSSRVTYLGENFAFTRRIPTFAQGG
jgi:hypothetical protein